MVRSAVKKFYELWGKNGATKILLMMAPKSSSKSFLLYGFDKNLIPIILIFKNKELLF